VLSQYSFISSGGPVSIAGNELPYSPETTLIIGLEQTLLKKINLRLDYKYVSEVFTDFHNLDQSFISNIGIQGPVDSYSLINFSLNYEISDKIGFNIVGKNLMDRVYIGSRLHSNPDQRQANISSGIIPGNRRQINIGIQFKF
jgi:Fe(3+) dicitrate transport protein